MPHDSTGHHNRCSQPRRKNSPSSLQMHSHPHSYPHFPTIQPDMLAAPVSHQCLPTSSLFPSSSTLPYDTILTSTNGRSTTASLSSSASSTLTSPANTGATTPPSTASHHPHTVTSSLLTDLPPLSPLSVSSPSPTSSSPSVSAAVLVSSAPASRLPSTSPFASVDHEPIVDTLSSHARHSQGPHTALLSVVHHNYPPRRADMPCSAFAAAAARGRQVDMFLSDPRRSSISSRTSLQSNRVDMPVGKVPLLHPPLRPHTPRRLPRPRVFIRQPPRPSSVDVAAVVSATGPDGADQRCLITRPVARPSSQALTPPSSIAVTPRTTSASSASNYSFPNSSHSSDVQPCSRLDALKDHNSNSSCSTNVLKDGTTSPPKLANRVTSRCNLPPAPPPPRPSRRISSDAKFYFSDNESEDGDRHTNSRRVRSLRSLRTRRASTSAVTVDDLSFACSSPRTLGPVTHASAPPSTIHDAPQRNVAGLIKSSRMPSEPCLSLVPTTVDRPRPPIANVSATSPGIDRRSGVQGPVRVVPGNENADAFSRVRRAVSALRSLSFQNGCSEDLDTAWGQATSSGDQPETGFLRKDRSSHCFNYPDANTSHDASCDRLNNPNTRTPQMGRKWCRPKGRVSSQGLREFRDGDHDIDTDAGVDTDVDEDSSGPGPNNGRGLGISRGLALSMRRASERVERKLGNDTDGEDTMWPDASSPSHAVQRRGRLSAVYAAVPWNRSGRRNNPEPEHPYGITQFGFSQNSALCNAASRNERFPPSTSTRRPPSTRAHAHGHGGGHIPAWHRKSLWSNANGMRDVSCGCGNGLIQGGSGIVNNGGGCVCGGCACCARPGGTTEAAARLLLAGGGHALLAASAGTGTENTDTTLRSGKHCQHTQKWQHTSDQAHAESGPKSPRQAEVDKYVEFIHASAAREVSARRTLVRNKVVTRAQAVFRRRRK